MSFQLKFRYWKGLRSIYSTTLAKNISQFVNLKLLASLSAWAPFLKFCRTQKKFHETNECEVEVGFCEAYSIAAIAAMYKFVLHWIKIQLYYNFSALGDIRRHSSINVIKFAQILSKNDIEEEIRTAKSFKLWLSQET